MVAVFSHWSKPQLVNPNRLGWYNIFSEMLSLAVLLCKKNLKPDKILIITDTPGKELISSLNLPIDDIWVTLDNYPNYPVSAWPIVKTMAMGDIQEPFIHLDYDLYLISELVINPKSDIVVEYIDLIVDTTKVGKLYKEWARDITGDIGFNILEQLPNRVAFNNGVIGFLSSKALKVRDTWVSTVRDLYNGIPSDKPNNMFPHGILFEQYILAYLVRVNKLTFFTTKSSCKRYHLIGGVKNKKSAQKWVIQTLNEQFPNNHSNIDLTLPEWDIEINMNLIKSC